MTLAHRLRSMILAPWCLNAIQWECAIVKDCVEVRIVGYKPRSIWTLYKSGYAVLRRIDIALCDFIVDTINHLNSVR